MKLDLHVHTAYSSDAQGELREVIKSAMAVGLQGIAVVDHNAVQGSLKGVEVAHDFGDFLVVRGAEVTSSAGHILALGMADPVPRGLGPEETVERIRALGGIAIAAHPYRFWSGVGQDVVNRVRFDGVEAHNGRSVRLHNREARALTASLHLPTTGGSDAHAPRYIGRGITQLEGEGLREDDVLEAIVHGRTAATGVDRGVSSTLRYTVKCVGEWMGRGMRRM